RSRGIFVRVGNEREHFPVLDVADPDAALPAGVIPGDRARFGIGDVNVVALVDEDAARPAELRPLVDEVAVAIENLNAVVVAIAHEQASPRVECERVRLIELARTRAGFSPSFAQGAVLRELQNLRLALPVPLGNENFSRRRDDHVVWLEEVLGIDASARLAEPHQQFAVGAELEHLVALGGTRGGTGGTAGPRRGR